jgi:hypothetical protein
VPNLTFVREAQSAGVVILPDSNITSLNRVSQGLSSFSTHHLCQQGESGVVIPPASNTTSLNRVS